MEETAQAVVEFALQALNCSYSGVALAVRGRRLEVPAVTDPVVAEIYRFQTTGAKGPLVESLRDHSTVLVGDTATDQRWPEWSGRVLELGVRSVLDVPLTTAAGRVGVLGLYSAQPDAFGPDDEAIAHILARHASVAVANARQEQSMAAAVDARKLVGQAMGILMERFDVDGDRAFAILKRYSQDTNTKLRDVAQHLIDTRKLPHCLVHADTRAEARNRPDTWPRTRTGRRVARSRALRTTARVTAPTCGEMQPAPDTAQVVRRYGCRPTRRWSGHMDSDPVDPADSASPLSELSGSGCTAATWLPGPPREELERLAAGRSLAATAREVVAVAAAGNEP